VIFRDSLAVPLTFALVFVPMIIEAIISARHDRALRAEGAIEPDGDVYKIMQLAYPGCFLALIAEGVWRGASWNAMSEAGLAVFVAAKALKYWAIASLGRRWTFRVLVPPGSTPTRSGPYQWVNHPNYIAVAGELIGAAAMTHAFVTGVPVVTAFSYLMWRRVQIEEKALARK
jgi:methyltransferase